jgi:DNA-binding MarR family transcriptional regulator
VPDRGDDLTDADYRRLLDFRDGLRRFLRWSEDQAKAVGLTPAQHQLLLAIRGHDDPDGPTIGDVAHHLLLRHNSAVELLDRAQGAGLVERVVDEVDHRVVRLRLTRDGERRLAALTEQHLEELRRLGPRLRPLWAGLS